jgi:hypothetical protein
MGTLSGHEKEMSLIIIPISSSSILQLLISHTCYHSVRNSLLLCEAEGFSLHVFKAFFLQGILRCHLIPHKIQEDRRPSLYFFLWHPIFQNVVLCILINACQSFQRKFCLLIRGKVSSPMFFYGPYYRGHFFTWHRGLLLPNLLRILECPFRMLIQPVLSKILVPLVSTSRQMRHYSFPPPYISLYNSAITRLFFSLSLTKRCIKLKNKLYLCLNCACGP